MGKALSHITAIVLTMGMVAALIITMTRGMNGFNGIAKSAVETTNETSEMLADEKYAQFDNRTVSGDQIVKLIEDSIGERIVISVSGDNYVYSDLASNTKTDANEIDMIERARSSINSENLYNASVIRDNNGTVIAINFELA